MDRKWSTWLSVAVLSLAVGASAFFGVRALAGGTANVVADEGTAAGKGPDAVEVAWNEYQQEPSYAQLVNGILVGPDVQRPGTKECDGIERRTPSDEEIVGADVEVNPAYLPKGVKPFENEAVACGKTVVLHAIEYQVPDKVGKGKGSLQSFRDLEWGGGTFGILRMRGIGDSYPLNGPAESVVPTTIKGRPAVLAYPFRPEGIDNGSFEFGIVIKEPFGITTIQGAGLPLAEFIKIAESLY